MRPQPVGVTITHLARLDVAHVGGADQVEGARLRADDPARRRAGRARAGGSRADRATAISRSFGQQHEARTRPRPARRLRRAPARRRRPRSREQVQRRPRCRCWSGRSTPSRTSSSRSSSALTRLPLWHERDLPVRAVDRGSAGRWRAGSRRPSSSGRGRPRSAGQLGQRRVVEDVGDVAHRLRDADLRAVG